ncbi:MAG: ATP-binding protein [Aquificae bacterium]|nr:ATP-binding protein [Aquificota bacterium]
MLVAKTKEEALKIVKGESVIETDRLFWVKTKNGIIRVFKPISKELIIRKLQNGNFPERYLEDVFSKSIKKTQAILVALKSKKEGLLLSGKAGVGKTFACIYKVAKLIQEYKINAPLYISLQDFNIAEERERLKDFDTFLLDDFNPNLNEYEKKFAINVIYYAYHRKKKIFITTNADIKTFFEFLNEEPILSRLRELTDIKVINDKDYRLEVKR